MAADFWSMAGGTVPALGNRSHPNRRVCALLRQGFVATQLRLSWWWVWGIMLMAGVVLAATLVTSTKAKLDYRAIVVEGVAALPTDDQRLRRHLHDGDELTQWFVAPVRRLVRVGIGASDPRLNPPSSLLVVDLISEAGEVIASTNTSVGQLRTA